MYLAFHVPLLTPLLQQNKQNQAVVDEVDAEGKTFDVILYGERQAGAGRGVWRGYPRPTGGVLHEQVIAVMVGCMLYDAGKCKAVAFAKSQLSSHRLARLNASQPTLHRVTNRRRHADVPLQHHPAHLPAEQGGVGGPVPPIPGLGGSTAGGVRQ